MHGRGMHTEGWPETFADATLQEGHSLDKLFTGFGTRARLNYSERGRKKRKTAQLLCKLHTFCTDVSLPLFEMCPVTPQSTRGILHLQDKCFPFL